MEMNSGFLVKNDRFSLRDGNLYILTGWLIPGTSLSASLAGRKIPADVTPLTENVDERFGGCETRVEFRIPDDIPERGFFRLTALSRGKRHTAFVIALRELREKRRPIRYFIDEFRVDRQEGFVRVQGWAVSTEKVRVDVYGKDGRKLLPAVGRYKRWDTAELFREYPVDPESGFLAEVRPVPPGGIRVRFRTSADEIVLRFPTDVSAVRMHEAERILRKSRETLRTGGPELFARKAWNRLFNPAMKTISYGEWIRHNLPGERELRDERRTEFERMPLVSIVVPLYRTPEKYLRALVDSVKAQSYVNWELVLSDGSGADSPLTQVLEEFCRTDSRIRALHNGRALKIADNTNAAIEAASGEWIVFADHDDVLAASALFEIVRALNHHPDAELIYTDEDKLGYGDQYMQPNFKPDYDPDFLTSVNYICHILSVKRTLLDETGYLDPDYDGAQDYDLILRCTEKTNRIVHVPKVLYHWRFFEGSTSANPESKAYAFEAGKRAINAHYRRLGWPAEAENGEYPGIYRTRWHWKEHPRVSVIIPNKDHLDDLRKCISSLEAHTAWPEYEIVVIENNSVDPETFSGYETLAAEHPRVRVVRYEGGFNYSAINNFGVRHADGAYLLFLNNDTEFISDALTEMMGYAMRPDVGAVGARLYYEDDTIQHAGAIIGWGGVAGHAFVGQKRGVTGYQHRIILQQDVSAVTAACMLVRRDVFEKADGFTEELAVAFNDIDLCMKIRAKGYLIVYNPFAELYHYESKTRGLEDTPEKKSRFGREILYFQRRWPDILRDGDPYYNPNLSMITQDFSLKKNW